MEKYIYNEQNGLWYELQGDYYIPCLVLDKEDTQPIGMWGRKYLRHIREHQVMAENMLFQNSFRLGARIMLEVMRD